MPRRMPWKDANPGFWVQSGPKQIARALQGKGLVLGDIRGVVRQAEGYGRLEGMRVLYEPMLEMEPGRIYCPRLARAILLVIAVHDEGRRGGRVLIREIEVDGEVITGPGNVSRWLGVNKSKTTGSTLWLDNQTFQIILEEGEQ